MGRLPPTEVQETLEKDVPSRFVGSLVRVLLLWRPLGG
ncbi:hypothetical protein ARMA_0772 [Ardenticatena maritima]|uniref:Uncharacterized protein n=1 Tax=Ardenticatena maritima TaxID=872965 RepID=A0A0M8K815_9CHLR|nr:hypothetical protein ARMA_0772 [Ardenticatena maritima]